MISNTRRQELREKYRNSEQMAVSSIRFTQKSINNTFSNGAPIQWTIYMLKTKQIKPCEIALIRVGKYNGYYKSIDNRRLYCYKTAGIKKIPVIVMETITNEFYCKDQSPNNGVSVKIISDPKPVSYRRNIVTAYNPITQKGRSWTVGQIIAECKTRKGSTKKKTRMTSKGKSVDGARKPSQSKTAKVWTAKSKAAQSIIPQIVWTAKSNPKINVDAMKEKSHKNAIYFCIICDRKMSFRDKSYHLNGKGHGLNLKKQIETNQDEPIKSMASKPKICNKNNNRNNKVKSAKTVKAELKDNNNNNRMIQTAKPKKKQCIGNMVKTKTIEAATKEKVDTNKIYFCTVCDRKMSVRDKSNHLKGKGHELNLKKQNLKNQNKKNQGRPRKTALSKATISGKNNNRKKEIKSSKISKAELKAKKAKPNQTEYIYPKMAIDSSQFEFQQKIAQKNKEIKWLELKLNDERIKCKSLTMINKKLILIESNNNKRNDIMIDSMRKQMNYLRNRISEQEMELNEYKENKESLDVCCCCKKRKD